MKAEDAADILDITTSKEGSGNPDYANKIGGVKALKGEIKPGDTVSGEALFDVSKVDKYYLQSGIGLSYEGSGLVNKLIWTFKASEVK